MQEHEHVLQEAVQYFRSEPGFARPFRLMADKYRSLGRIGGSIVLEQPSAEERKALSSYLRTEWEADHPIRFTLARFVRQLEHTRFGGIDFLKLLEQVTGRQLVTKAEERQQRRRAKELFFHQMETYASSRYGRVWLQAIRLQPALTARTHKLYEQDPAKLEQALQGVLVALHALEWREERASERLPLFAERVLHDPHALDHSTECGRLFVEALTVIRQEQKRRPSSQAAQSPAEEGPLTSGLSEWPEQEDEVRVGYTEWLNELYYEFGLLRDDLHNFVTCSGIVGTGRDGRPHPVWLASLQQKSVLNVPLRELTRIHSWSLAVGRNVFVFENSGVFSAVMDHWEQRDNIPPMVCTHGQFKLAALVLLQGLADAGATLYYSGDFDPEGLRMADFIYRRFPGRVRLWRYTPADYENALSNVTLSSHRLNMRTSFEHRSLRQIAELMRQYGKAGYQESMVPALIRDMEALI